MSENPPALSPSATDYVVSAAKSALGTIPFVGSLLTEIAGSIIPNQRVDRIAKFAEELDHRISEIEKAKLIESIKNEEFTDLIEETIRQAARSTSDERRSYLASIIANGLESDDITFSESKELAKLLSQLSDIEVIWLRSYQVITIGGDKEFRSKHADVLERVTPTLGSARGLVDRAAIQGKYQKHLVDLGLIKGVIAKDRDGNPALESSGDFKISYYQITSLGDFLLRWIGISTRP
jgi:hypothetical protein